MPYIAKDVLAKLQKVDEETLDISRLPALASPMSIMLVGHSPI